MDPVRIGRRVPAPARDAEPTATQLMRIPSPLLCYWMGATGTPPEALVEKEQGAGGHSARKN